MVYHLLARHLMVHRLMARHLMVRHLMVHHLTAVRGTSSPKAIAEHCHHLEELVLFGLKHVRGASDGVSALQRTGPGTRRLDFRKRI